MIRGFQRHWLSLLAAAIFICGPARAQQAVQPLPATSAPMAGVAKSRLPAIRSWGYQLQGAEIEEIANSPFDLVVIDYSRSGDDGRRFRPGDIKRMQRKPDGGRRAILAYLSIGEAETYRYYWNKAWVEPVQVLLRPEKEQFKEPAPSATGKSERSAEPESEMVQLPPQLKVRHYPRLTAPSWLGHETDAWAKNFHVRYWEKGWQDIIFGSPSAYLDRIVASGFDGVYLDRVDAFYGAEQRPGSKAEMASFVIALARHARTLNPGFAVVAQNGEELLKIPDYLAELDGVAKEDLFYGYEDGQPNPPFFIRNSLDWLAHAKRQGLPVLVVEYLHDAEAIRAIGARILEQGFVPYFADRALDHLTPPGMGQPQAPATAPPKR